jgi:hypothetical protein
MSSHPNMAWEERELRAGVRRLNGRDTLSAFAAVLLPFKAPSSSPTTDAAARLWWKVVCVLSVLPIAALLHWGVFHRPTCMLNNFGHEYTPAVIWAWLSRDPALPWAMVMMAAAYHIGMRRSLVRALIAPGFAAGLLFTLWIWDVPFSGRVVCGHFHDNEFMLAAGVPLRSVHVLGVCTALYGSSMLWVLPRFVGIPGRRQGRSTGKTAPAAAMPAGIPVFATAAYPRARFNPDHEH